MRLKREIVTMGQPDVDPLAGTGQYKLFVDPMKQLRTQLLLNFL